MAIGQSEQREPYDGVADERVTVRIPTELLEDVDQAIEDGEYYNRSVAIREALRTEIPDGDRR